MPDPFPLNETALQAARKAVVKAGVQIVDSDGRLTEDVEDRIFVSTYLAEAGFEVQENPGRDEARLLGPWVPIDTQAAAEETTRRIEREHSAGDTKTFNDSADAAAYLRNEPIDTVEKED
jgi:hypothetical protein